jgi:hypothetical protein
MNIEPLLNSNSDSDIAPPPDALSLQPILVTFSINRPCLPTCAELP